MKLTEMSVIQFIKANSARVIGETLHDFLVESSRVIEGVMQIGYGLFNIVSITLILPFYVLLWLLCAKKAIRDARQKEAKTTAEEQGKTEIYRTPVAKFNTKLKALTMNLIVHVLGLHTMMGIPDFDFMQRDPKNGDMVYYKVGGARE